MMPLCPNFETCQGELTFDVTSESQGEGAWSTFMGYSAECTEQTCDCELTDEQWQMLQDAAVEYDPEP